MGKNIKKPKSFRRKGLRAKLTIDEYFAETPLYSIKATTTEKDKGIRMLELIENNFNISERDREAFMTNRLKEFNKDAMTPTEVPKSLKDKQVKIKRDEKGRIVSPFVSKEKPSWR